MAATATLAEKTVSVAPGGEATVEVRVRNSGTIVDQFTLEVLGDSAAWAIVEPAVVPLFPGAEATARVRFKPPKSPSVLARAVPFAVRVKSREDARASLVEEGTVTVGPYNDTFAELIPRTAKGRTRARAQLALDNRGNTPINARLTAADPDRKLNLTPTPPALTAEPGTASFASIRLTPRQRFLTGPPKMVPYKVMVHQDGQPTITVDGTMQQEALIPGWLIPVAIAALALLLILAILWFTLLRPALVSTAQQAATNSAAVKQANDTANAALAKAQQAINNKAQTPTTDIIGPNGGPAYSGRLSANGNNDTTNFLQVPTGGNWAVTDLVFENPGGNSGTLEWKRDDGVLLSIKLENFRDIDFHFVTPQVFKEGQKMQLHCAPDPGSKCDAAVYFSGYFLKPPS